MYILGISAYYHDSAVALLKDETIIAAAQEERFSRIKQDAAFPEQAIRYCLDTAGIVLAEVELIVFYDKPFLKFERILETMIRYAPKGFSSFRTGISLWIKEKLFFKSMIRKHLLKVGPVDFRNTKLLFTEHHQAHAASAFFPSPFREAAVLTIDGVGEWTTLSICHGKDNSLRILKEMHFPHSVGLLYSAFTYFLGFKVNLGEYKLMGLAPYGSEQDAETTRFIRLIKEKLICIHNDGSICLTLKYFRFHTGLTMINQALWENLFGIKRRMPESEITRSHCNLAIAIQKVLEEIVCKLAAEAKKLTGLSNLCLAGGVALNCVANSKILTSGLFSGLFIQPAAGDAGGALGAALAAHYIYRQQPRTVGHNDCMQGALLGPAYPESAIIGMCTDKQAVYEKLFSIDDVCERTACLLAEGNSVGWFQGRMEFGPRALGNRSILADPRSASMQRKLNLSIKYRESFRPFAPAVLKECASIFFKTDTVSPYMLFTADISEAYRNEVPPNYQSFSVKDKLSFQKSVLPAITHVDFSSRLQTVDKEQHPVFWNLIHRFGQLTGIPVLINTSFNVRGEPIVCTPADAFDCFMNTELDYLVIENILFDKRKQTACTKNNKQYNKD